MVIDPNAVLALQIGGGLTSMVGSFYAAKSQQYALESQASSLQYQADINDINAQLAEKEAQSALLAGQRREQAVLLKGRNIQAAQKVATAANGIDVNSQTAVATRASTAFMTQADAFTISQNALKEAQAARMRKVGLENDSLLKRAGASGMLLQESGISPFGAAATSLMSSASQVAGSWYMMNKYGALGQPAPVEERVWKDR